MNELHGYKWLGLKIEGGCVLFKTSISARAHEHGLSATVDHDQELASEYCHVWVITWSNLYFGNDVSIGYFHSHVSFGAQQVDLVVLPEDLLRNDEKFLKLITVIFRDPELSVR